jgi:beta-lactamase class A
MRRTKIVLLLTLLSMTQTLFAQTAASGKPSLSATRDEIQKLIKDSNAESVAVALYNLKTGEELLINEHVSFHAASTMKVPVMMELFRQASAKQINLDSKLIVKNEFKSIVDGSPFTLDEKSDGDPDAYKLIGQEVSYRDLIQRMITRSSNLSTNILIEKVGADNVMKLMKQLKANDIKVLRGVEDGKAFEKGLNNTTTAYDLMILLRTIAMKKVASPAACDEMIKILLAQEFNTGIPAGLPEGTKVAHKTGSITKIRHDAAIVYPANKSPYVLVVLIKGIEEEKKSDKLTADISRVIYEAMGGK